MRQIVPSIRLAVPGSGAGLLAALVLAGLPSGPAEAQTVYLAFGDSITAGTGDDGSRPEPGYPPRLEDLLVESGRDAVVENHGVPGERTPGGLSRIDQVLDSGGDVLLLMEGTNDVQSGISLETALFNLGEMADRAEARGFSVIHATVIPRLTGPASQRSRNRFFVQGVRNLAGTAGRSLADPYEVFVNTGNLFQCCYADLADDRVGHPNARGYDMMAQTFFDVIRGVDRVPPVTSRLEPSPGAELDEAPPEVVMEVRDFGTGIDLSALSLLIDGAPVQADLSGEAGRATLTLRQTSGLSGQVTVGLRARDRAEPRNSVDRDVATFTVGALVTEGDVNGDGRIDGVDLVRLAVAFGASRGSARYDQAADLDGDGTVDGMDLAILADGFGRSVG